MDDRRFDAWTRGFGARSIPISRRAGLRLLAAGALIPTLHRFANPVAEANKKHKRKKKRKDGVGCEAGLGTPCTSSADCCGAICCKPAPGEGICCTTDSPICFVFGTKAACIER